MAEETPTLILIDGHALAYRAFHALPPEMSTAEGEATNAVFGFASMLLELLSNRLPDYLVVTFDLGRTFRHDTYADYKATREAMPDALVLQMRRIRQLVESFGIPIYELEGWEADDLLGTLAAQAAGQGVSTLIVTGDTDAFQLVDEHTRVMTSGRRFSDTIVYDEERVRERYGLPPSALAQWKGLRGDTSDNIPGVPGIGDKTATKLLTEYADVEAVIAHAGELPGKKLGENIAAHADQARLSVELATIRRDAPITLDLAQAEFRGYDQRRVLKLFRELDFRTLVDRLPVIEGHPSIPADDFISGTYRLVTSLDELRELALMMAAGERFAFDTETTSVDQMRADLVGLSMSDCPGTGWYVPVGHRAPPAPVEASVAAQGRLDMELGPTVEAKAPPKGRRVENGAISAASANLPLEQVVGILQPLFASGATKVAHNAKYDLVVLKRHGLEVADPILDTMVAAWVAEPSRRAFSLKDLAWSKIGVTMSPISDLLGRGRAQLSFDQVPVGEAAAYAGADVDATLRLADVLLSDVAAAEGEGLMREVESPLMRVLADMEMTGILVDAGRLAEISAELGARLTALEDHIFGITGNPFNIASPQQLSQVLFEQMKIPRGRRTLTGFSTSAGALGGLEKDFPIVALVLEWRHLSKLRGTYVDALPLLIHPDTGRIHTSFNQAAVITGRISSTDPNLQNIPVRSEQGEQIRSAFIAAPGHVLMAADYSQMELRVLAHLADDPTLQAIFGEGGDIHAATGAFLFDKAPEEVTSNERRIAKMVNFGVLYGMSPYGLADRTGLTREEASGFIDRYFSRYSAVKAYFDRVLEGAAENGYVETILGRRRHFPELRRGAHTDRNNRMRAQREAVNAPIQGSAADIMKVAMIHLHRTLTEAGLGARMLLQVHDELLLEVPAAEVAATAELTRREMANAVEINVGLVVDLSVGPNWLDLSRYRAV